PKYVQCYSHPASAFPAQVAFQAALDEKRAHLIEAGSDLFLMPSRYEPCGLNQMYSLRYGTAPIVHKTGGVADTVEQFDGRDGTGFVFDHFNEAGLGWALERALDVFENQPRWLQLQQNGMQRQFGWNQRIGEYV